MSLHCQLKNERGAARSVSFCLHKYHNAATTKIQCILGNDTFSLFYWCAILTEKINGTHICVPYGIIRYSRRERIYPFRKMPPGLYRRQIALFTIKAILQPFGGVSANVIPYSLIILIVANDMVIKRRLPQLPRM